MKKRNALLFIVMILLAFVCGAAAAAWYFLGNPHRAGEQDQSRNFGMFSWGETATLSEERDRLSRVISSAGVTEIYQEFSEDLLGTDQMKGFLSQMAEQSVEVYALVGDASWGEEADGASLIGAMQKIVQVNAGLSQSQRIQGMMVDVEPYLLDAWDEGDQAREELMEAYRAGMTQAYEYAHSEGLEMLVCIPTFYDLTCETVLEEIVAECCDGIAVMNYNRENEYAQMEAEVSLAEEYDKRVICIYELQQPGKHDLTDINTYYHTGLEVLRASSETLEQRFSYQELGFAYHYYDPLKELLGLS